MLFGRITEAAYSSTTKLGFYFVVDTNGQKWRGYKGPSDPLFNVGDAVDFDEGAADELLPGRWWAAGDVWAKTLQPATLIPAIINRKISLSQSQYVLTNNIPPDQLALIQRVMALGLPFIP